MRLEWDNRMNLYYMEWKMGMSFEAAVPAFR